jgi:predicted ribosomally synthesized peptide with SipW-like signal peptide
LCKANNKIQKKDKTMKKILIISMACVLCLGLIGGAFAYFTDTETSTGNAFTAGANDLQISNGGPWVDSDIVLATAVNMAPGVEVGPFDVWFLNNGTMDGKVRVTFTYANYDDPAAYGEYAVPAVTGMAYAKKLVVTSSTMDGGTDNKAIYWGNAIAATYPGGATAAVADGLVVASGSDYLPTIYGLSVSGELRFTEAYPTEDVWSPGESHYETFKLMLSTDADEAYAFDGVKITLTAKMLQYNDPTP